MLACFLAGSVTAADLNPIVAEVMRYESGKDAAPLRQLEQAVQEAVADPAQRPALEAALIQLLSPEATFEARRFACVQLSSLGTDACLPAVAELFKKPETVGMACLALGTHPSAKADDLLMQNLAASTGEARAQIIATLGDRRVAGAVKALEPQARETDRDTREAAIGALGKIATPEALTVLAALRRDSNVEVARLAALASLVAADRLAQAGDAKAAALYDNLFNAKLPLYARRAALEGLLRTDADGGEQRCLTILRGAAAELKPSAINHVRRMKNPAASKIFAAELPKLTPAEQVLLIDSLAARNDAAAREAIIQQTQARDEQVRQAAVVALVQVGDASVVPVLAKTLTSSAPAQQQTIEMALASLKGGDQVDQAIARAIESAPAAAKPGLMNAAARRGSKSAVPALLTQAASADAATVRAAFRALGRLAEPAVLPDVLEKLVALKAPAARSDAESAAIKVIEREPAPERRSPPVVQVLAKTKDTESRVSLIALLPACGDAQALAAVKAERAGPDAVLRDAALRALTEWPNAAAADTLFTEAEKATQNTERVLALRGGVRLLGLGSDLPASTITAQCQRALALARNANEKKLVISGLAGMQHGAALTLLTPLLDDAAVQAEAVQAAMTLAPKLCGAFPESTKAALQKIANLPVDPAMKKAAAQLLATTGKFDDFIMGWQVAGPYVVEGKSGQELYDVVFGPELAGAANVKWQLMPAGSTSGRPWQLDLSRFYGGDNRVAYAQTWIYSPVSQAARLEVGCDDGVKAWVNNRVVITANRGGDVVPGAEKATVTLMVGWNRVLLKITQWSAGWGYCAKVVKLDGTPMSDLKYSATPPAN